MPTRTLPPQPSLVQLKTQANELRRLHRLGDPSATARISTYIADTHSLKLSDAQLVIAREYGFESWPKLKHFVELGHVISAFNPHPHFDEAVALLDAGDVEGLRSLLHRYPELVHARTNLEPPYHYFTGATLLHHIAGNPDRGTKPREEDPMPPTIVDVGRLLLESGADVHARTLGPNGGTTMGLVLTSAKASFSGVSGGLIDLLIEYGDSVDVRSTEALYGSLINHAPRAAEKLIELGAKPDLFVAAGLGNMELVRACFDESGRVKARPRRHGRVLSQRDSIGLAMLVAYVRDQRAVVDFLLERDGNWNMVGVNNGTALHRAASQDDLPMVERLVRLGADISDRNNPFVATPLSWADHLGHPRIVQWFRSNCAIDIHDAVCFDFLEHVEARLTENPASVNERRSQWSTPQATPLHCAAMTNRPELAAHLLDRGADPSLIAGNGLTALEMAQRSEATELVRLLS